MKPGHRDAIVAGTVLGIFSAIGYSTANVFLRAVADCDPFWVSFIKAVPTCLIMGLVLLAGPMRRPKSWQFVFVLALSALFMHLGGNVAFQWSLGIVGMAIAVPLTLGTIILSGAVLGRVFLGESISYRMGVSMLTLIVAICVLSAGARDASRAMADDLGAAGNVDIGWLTAGVAAACLSGIAYAAMGVVMRYGLMNRLGIPATLFTVSTTGVLSLGLLSYLRLGGKGIAETTSADLQAMIWAGIFTTIAFVALAKALQLTTVIFVNALNASQAAMCAVAGIVFFQEAPSAAMWCGVALTIVGLLLMKQKSTRAHTDKLADKDIKLAESSAV